MTYSHISEERGILRWGDEDSRSWRDRRQSQAYIRGKEEERYASWVRNTRVILYIVSPQEPA